MKSTPHRRNGLRERRVFLAHIASIAVIGLTLGATGCTSSSPFSTVFAPYQESGNCLTTNLRASMIARKIWRQKYAHCYGRATHAKDIRNGFVDGFVDKCLGGDGCPPLVPPKSYCAFGRKIEANRWFQGYPLGVAAAESSGACGMCQTPVHPSLSAHLAMPACSPGCVPCAPAGGGQMQPHMIESQHAYGGAHSHEGQEPLNPPTPPADEGFDAETEDPDMVPPAPVPTDAPDDFPGPGGRNGVRPVIEDDLPSPNDRAPAEAIERAIDDVTGLPQQGFVPQQDFAARETFAPQQTIETPQVDFSTDPAAPPVPIEDNTIIIRRPAVQPVVNDPVSVSPADVAPQFMPKLPIQPTPQQSPVTAPVEAPVFGNPGQIVPPPTESPVVGAPVELPNMQVGYDFEGVDWLFSDVDITRTLLERELPVLGSDR